MKPLKVKKMKNSLLVLLLLGVLSSVKVRAQDLIVTTKGDSINCKITQEAAEFIHFAYMKEGKPFKTLLHVRKIETFQKGFYGASADTVPVAAAYDVKKPEGGWRFGVNGGYARRLAKVSEVVPGSYRDYVNKLKSGFVVGGICTTSPLE
jgi:hypothetical protein